MVRIVPWIPPVFRDRAAAGRALAETLRGQDGVVVGVARGGVAVAAEVARGATTAHGPPFLLVPEAAVEDVVARARREAERLESRLEHETLPVEGREALLVDDGAITGLTLAAACLWARAEGAAKVVAAVPVCVPLR